MVVETSININCVLSSPLETIQWVFDNSKLQLESEDQLCMF